MNYFFQEHLTIEKNQEQFFFSKNISRTFQERSHPVSQVIKGCILYYLSQLVFRETESVMICCPNILEQLKSYRGHLYMTVNYEGKKFLLAVDDIQTALKHLKKLEIHFYDHFRTG